MNIKHENVPGQLQEVTIEINKEDYAAELDAALKKQRRTATVPGFRPGNSKGDVSGGPRRSQGDVPAGLRQPHLR